MLLSPRKTGLTSLFKEVRVFEGWVASSHISVLSGTKIANRESHDSRIAGLESPQFLQQRENRLRIANVNCNPSMLRAILRRH